jgi:hypothetical protein
MKFRKYLLLGFLAILVGCGHGYEGEYTAQGGSANQFLNAFVRVMGDRTIVIGRDYVDSEGKRTDYEDIFVRESGGKTYLVFKKDKDSEEAWKVLDKDTLIQSGDLFSVTYKRLKT